MIPPRHYRFLLDFVEETAKGTPSILFQDSESFWDDLLEAWDRREEKRSYWLFATRWMREQLVGVASQGSPRALAAILTAVEPHRLYSASWIESDIKDSHKSRLVATLLPILMKEMVQRVRNRSQLRYGDAYVDDPFLHPEDP